VGLVEKTITYDNEKPRSLGPNTRHEGRVNCLYYPRKSQPALLGNRKGHLFMDYVGDMNLTELSEARVRGDVNLSPEALYEIAYNLIAAVKRFHEKIDEAGKKYVILDGKPANIRVDVRTREVFLVDFGLSREVGIGAEALGTPIFMSPETLNRKPHAQTMDYFVLPLILFLLFNPSIEEDSDTDFYTLAHYETDNLGEYIVETEYIPHKLKIAHLPNSNHTPEQKQRLIKAMIALTHEYPRSRGDSLDGLLAALEPLKTAPAVDDRVTVSSQGLGST